MTELVLIAITLAVVTSAVAAARRRQAASSTGATTATTSGATWTAAGGPAAAFPLERTQHERDIGDAAFVDGLIVGHHYLGDGRGEGPGGRTATVHDDRDGLGHLEGLEALAADDGPPLGTDALDEGDLVDDLEHHDAGFDGGFDDAFDDAFDDGW